MPRACSNCRRAGVECKVHVRSGTCGECHLKGGTCDIRITQEEWQRLLSERARLLMELKTAQTAQKAAEAARQVAEKARKEAEQARHNAIEQESVLREELRKVELEAEESIAVEEAQIAALERHEEEQRQQQAPQPASEDLALSPFTWSAGDGIGDDFWGPSPSVAWVLTSGS